MDHIYALTDPRDQKFRYIGKTDNLKRRLAAHLIDRDVCHRTNWIQELLALGLKPGIALIESIPENQNWEERERYWIAHYRTQGCKLTNGSDGGDQGPDCTGMNLVKTPAGLENIRAALARRNKSPEMREVSRRNGLRNKGRKESPERIAEKSQWMTGRKHHTDAFKQALAERNRTTKLPTETARKNARALWDDPIKGPEMRAALAERNRKRKNQDRSE